jgi:hypothetical protein
MDKKILTTRPSYDKTTYYLHKWSEKIIEAARKRGMDVIDLEKDKTKRQRVAGTLRKANPGMVVLNGHGSAECVAGHDGEEILDEENVEAAKGAIIYARACKSARLLGKSAISKGVVTYIGYDEDFIFVIDEPKISKPLEDESAALFLEPSNYVSIAIIKGHTAGDANLRSKKLFKNNIRNLLVQGPTSANFCLIRYLFRDMEHQICRGDQTAKL